MKKLLLSVAVLCCFALVSVAQQTTESEKAKSETKTAAKEAKSGAKETAKDSATMTKGAAKVTKEETKEAAQATKTGTVKVAKKTKDVTLRAAKATKDGTVKVSKKVAAGTKKAAIATKDAVTGNKHDDSHLVDLNSASREQLVALPGVGEVYAQKIINGRPYANKAQLVSRGIVPGNNYAQFHQHVVARQ